MADVSAEQFPSHAFKESASPTHLDYFRTNLKKENYKGTVVRKVDSNPGQQPDKHL